MQVTMLPDVRAAAAASRGRRVRRRPPRPPRGDPRQRHGAHVRAAPAPRGPARGGAEAADEPRGQGRADRGARRRRAGRDPVRRRVRRTRRPRSSSTTCWSSGFRRRTCRWARTSASGTARLATRRCWRADERFETRVVPLVEVDGEIVSSSHIRGLVLAGEVETATRFLGAPFQLRGEVVKGDQRGRTLGFPPPTSCPTRRSCARPRHLRRPHRRRPAPRSASACGRRSAPAGRAGRGLSARLRRGPVRPDAADRLPRAAARRAPVRLSRGAGRADGPRRRAHARALRAEPRPATFDRPASLIEPMAITQERKQSSPPSSETALPTPARPRSRSR